MRKILFLIIGLCWISSFLFAQDSIYVKKKELTTDSLSIYIKYKLKSKYTLYNVSPSITDAAGNSIIPTTIVGDTGIVKLGGKKKIIWQASADIEKEVLKIYVKAEPVSKVFKGLVGVFYTPTWKYISIEQSDIQTYRFASNQSVKLEESRTINFEGGVGFSGTYFFNRWFGLGLQLGCTSYQTTLKADNLNISYSATDVDKHTHIRYLTINNLEEKLQLNYLTFTPHIAFMQNLSYRLRLYSTVGVQVGRLISKTYTYEGIFTSKNEYEANTLGTNSNFVLHAIDSDGNGIADDKDLGNSHYHLYTNHIVKGENGSLQTNIIVALQLSTGFLYQCRSRWYVGLSSQLSIGFNNSFDAQQEAPDNILLKEYDNYQSLIGASSKSTLFGCGLQLGVFYRL